MEMVIKTIIRNDYLILSEYLIRIYKWECNQPALYSGDWAEFPENAWMRPIGNSRIVSHSS